MKNKRFICMTALFLLSALFLGSMAVIAMPGETNKYNTTKPEGDTTIPETEGETVVIEQLNAPAGTKSNKVTLRVGTFNIQNGGGVGHDFSVLAQDILDQKLDVVGLQEVDMFTSRNKG